MQQSNKQRKRDQLRQNQLRGQVAEKFVEAWLPLEGRIPIRIGHGSDFEARRVGPALRNPITGRVEPSTKLIEVKSGKARLTPLQKKTQRKNKNRYEVRRPLLYRDTRDVLKNLF